MGDVADMMIDGTLCEECGVYLKGESLGVPRRCADCEDLERREMSDLAACKRCGGEALPDNIYNYGRQVGYRVFCNDCDNHGPLSPTKDAAVRAWNKEQPA